MSETFRSTLLALYVVQAVHKKLNATEQIKTTNLSLPEKGQRGCTIQTLNKGWKFRTKPAKFPHKPPLVFGNPYVTGTGMPRINNLTVSRSPFPSKNMESNTLSRNGFELRTELSRRVRGRPPGVSLMTYRRSSSPSSARAPGAGAGGGAAAMTGAAVVRQPVFRAQLLKHGSLPLLERVWGSPTRGEWRFPFQPPKFC
jgi:hypothetical protein